MVMFCAAFGCTNKAKAGNKLSFHQFPTAEGLRKEWIIAMKRDNFSPTTNTKICSAHFKEEDFERHFGQKKLKQGVIPSMFNFPEQLRKEEPKVRSERLKSIKTKEDTSALPTTLPLLDKSTEEAMETLSSTTIVPFLPFTRATIDKTKPEVVPRKRRRSVPVYMGDFTYEDMADASKSQMMWKIANKTIDQKRKRISYLETRVKRLNKKVQTLTDLLMLFKKEKGEVSITTRHLPNLKQFTRD